MIIIIQMYLITYLTTQFLNIDINNVWSENIIYIYIYMTVIREKK